MGNDNIDNNIDSNKDNIFMSNGNGHAVNGHTNIAMTISDNNNSKKTPIQETPFQRTDGVRRSRASIRRVEPTKNDNDKEKPANNDVVRKPSTASVESRATWSSKWEFLLSCVGLSVGIGNVWRFPYLAYENGGGAFLIPYLIMLTIAGKPMYFMELALGQFGGYGPLRIWRCAPIAKGVGAAMLGVSMVVCVYYNVVMCYTLYFIGHSFQSVLPWQRCDGDWAVGTNCTVRAKNSTPLEGAKSSSQVFWERKVLDITSGIDDLGGVKWDLALCLAISWIIVILCLVRGVKSSGKVVYFAATFPYVILISLLIAGLLQKGSWEGVKYFITPSWDKLLSIKVWQAAAGQMFYSLSVSMGGLIMYSSYNNFRHNIFHDAMVVSVLDTITSIISGLVIFSVLGAMAHDLGPDVSVADVVKSGPGLAFITYPEALTRLPCPQLWSVLFFLMLFILGLDSEFAVLENILTSLSDEMDFFRRHRLKFCIGFGFTCFFLGLPCVTRGGQYIFDILDNHGGSIPLVFIAVAECVALMWVYGYDKLSFDIKFMLSRRLGWYWKYTWKFSSPIILALIFIYSLLNYKSLQYGDYVYPMWAQVFGICLTLAIALQVPGWAIYAIYKQKKGDSLLEKVKMASRSHPDWGPRDEQLRLDWQQQKSGVTSTMTITSVHLNNFTLRNGKSAVDNPAFAGDN